MNKKLIFAIAGAVSICLGGAASADTLNFGNTPNGSDTFTSTSISFVNPGSTGPVNGIFTGFGCSNCLTMFGFTSSTATPFEVLSVSNGGNTDNIFLSSVSFVTIAGGIDILGIGTSVINGGPAQAISFFLTTQGTPGEPTSYSGTVTTTPVPPTWLMFTASLFGLALFAYRGSKKRASAMFA